MSYTYSTYTTALANLLVVSASDTNFTGILPSIIDYAEQRCYRDLDLISTTVRNSSASLAANDRTFTLPVPATGRYTIVDQINLVQSGTRTPLTPASQDFIDMAWPSATAASSSVVPSYYAMVTDQTLIVGPPPGAVITVEVVGKIRPTALSATNTTTYLSTYLPDLFMAASMVFGAGWQKNFGSQGDDPKAAMSWEMIYKTQLASADAENQRAKFHSASWTSQRLETQAMPQRG